MYVWMKKYGTGSGAGANRLASDQRSSAESAPQKHVDVFVDAKVVQRGSRSDMRTGKVDLGFAQHLELGVRVFAGKEFAAALEHADGLSCAGEGQCSGMCRVPASSASSRSGPSS
jgi:hypothetical protein